MKNFFGPWKKMGDYCTLLVWHRDQKSEDTVVE